MKTTILPGEQDPTFKCPHCGEKIPSYIQDAYYHVLDKHANMLSVFSLEEQKMFLQGFTWQQYTSNLPPSTE